MGLIKAFFDSARGTLADQWLDFFTCDSLANNVLVQRGFYQRRGSNTKGNAEVITNGSKIVVPEGTAMMIVDDGGIAEFTAEAGAFTYDKSSEPSCFYGGFGKGLIDSFKTFGSRFAFGGAPAKDQRVYFINIKEIIDNKFGTANPIAYRDPEYRNIYITGYGTFSFRISDPIVFFKNISGNVAQNYTKDQLIDGQCKLEFMTALTTAISEFSGQGLSFSQLPGKQRELAQYMSQTLDEEWNHRRGMIVEAVALASVSVDERSRARVEQMDTAAVYGTNAQFSAGRMVDAQATAMESAAKNEAGAMTGFMGMGFAGGAMMGGQAPGNNAMDFLAQQHNQQQQQNQQNPQQQGGGGGYQQAPPQNQQPPQEQPPAPSQQQEAPPTPPPASAGGWKCSGCGHDNTGKFCMECGSKRPEEKRIKCDKCGWDAPAGSAPKFCPECGDPIDDKDLI